MIGFIGKKVSDGASHNVSDDDTMSGSLSLWFFPLLLPHKGTHTHTHTDTCVEYNLFNHHPSRKASSVSRLAPPFSFTLVALRRRWDQTEQKQVAQPFKRKGRPFPIFDLSIQVRLSFLHSRRRRRRRRRKTSVISSRVGVSLVLKQKENGAFHQHTHTNILLKKKKLSRKNRNVFVTSK